MTTLRVRREAATELEEALSWYEASEPNVARRLLRGYQDVVARIQLSPQAGSLVTAEPEIRRWVIRDFPYSVVFLLRADEVLILALAHHKRRPGYWQPRLVRTPGR